MGALTHDDEKDAPTTKTTAEDIVSTDPIRVMTTTIVLNVAHGLVHLALDHAPLGDALALLEGDEMILPLLLQNTTTATNADVPALALLLVQAVTADGIDTVALTSPTVNTNISTDTVVVVVVVNVMSVRKPRRRRRCAYLRNYTIDD